MKAFVYVLAALFFVTISASDTTWTGEGGSGNNTASNPLNWSNGIPTATSVVYLNDTSCTGTCTIIWDIDSTIAELHTNGSNGNGGYIQIVGGKNFQLPVFLPWVILGLKQISELKL
jgi:hypothetical protein